MGKAHLILMSRSLILVMKNLNLPNYKTEGLCKMTVWGFVCNSYLCIKEDGAVTCEGCRLKNSKCIMN